MFSRKDFESYCQQLFSDFPWRIHLYTPQQNRIELGQGKAHWYPWPLEIRLHTAKAERDFRRMNAYGLVERYLAGEVDFEGNYQLLSAIKAFVPIKLGVGQLATNWLKHRAFQTQDRARNNVKSHYDMPQGLLERYLDRRYMAYSCAMFEDATLRFDNLEQLKRPGLGENDRYDSLEKAQWRKFKDAVDFIAPAEGETLLDVGCGYGGQLEVALRHHPFGKVVGWTHSSNQVQHGRAMLEDFMDEQWEMNEGDYRQDERIFDHICSTGMISHVGPRGLKPYVRNIRRRIKTGGRYIHHALMERYSRVPLNRQVGIAFNKQYVWPGFHWFTLGEHIRLLERNGFRVVRVLNLRDQYSKTITAWYERFMAHEALMRKHMGDETFRAWRLYLGAGAGHYSGDVNRVYCVAV